MIYHPFRPAIVIRLTMSSKSQNLLTKGPGQEGSQTSEPRLNWISLWSLEIAMHFVSSSMDSECIAFRFESWRWQRLAGWQMEDLDNMTSKLCLVVFERISFRT